MLRCILEFMFLYRRRVQFYETDLMGVVHHSNYLKFLEEARVAWGTSSQLIKYNQPETAAHFAVLETKVRHLKPSKFGDELEIDLEVRRNGIRVEFQYRVRKNNEVVCVAQTVHAPLDKDLKPMKLSLEMRKVLEKSVWTETWL